MLSIFKEHFNQDGIPQKLRVLPAVMPLEIADCDTVLEFDDYVHDPEYNICWVQMCRHCITKYAAIIRGAAGMIDEDGGAPGVMCFVKGCSNEADGGYVDFHELDTELMNDI